MEKISPLLSAYSAIDVLFPVFGIYEEWHCKGKCLKMFNEFGQLQ